MMKKNRKLLTWAFGAWTATFSAAIVVIGYPSEQPLYAQDSGEPPQELPPPVDIPPPPPEAGVINKPPGDANTKPATPQPPPPVSLPDPVMPAGPPSAAMPAAKGPTGKGPAGAKGPPAKVVIPEKKTAKKVVDPNSDEKIGADAIPAGQELVNIDFPEPTEIRDIIKAVTLWTGKNVIIDRNVSGKIQIISPRKVTKEEAYQAFLSALNLLGYTTVETGKVIKIMQIRTAVRDNLKTFLGSDWTPLTDEIITQIVPLKYINAKEIQTTLSTLVSPNSIIAYSPTNTLIISDSGYKVKRVLDIVKLLDVQGQQPQVAIVPIRYSEATSVAEKVREILSGGGGKKNFSGSSSSGLTYKILVDERSNSVVIFGPPRTIADVKDLVRKFDVPLDDPANQSTIHVRPLDYADAKKLASTLTSLSTGGKSGARRPPISRPSDIASPNGGGGGSSVAELDDNVKITADESSNSLLITGSRAAYRALNTIIRKLDIRRSQVFVEADILDINVGNGFQAGTSIFAGAGSAEGTKVVTTWQAAGLAPLLVANAQQNAGTSGANPNLDKVAGVFAKDLTIGVISGKDVNIPGFGKVSPGALITLIKTDSNTRILSSPHILTANNEKATFTVGQKVFFRSSETNPTTGAVLPKIEKESADLKLEIVPNISTSNYVTMKIDLDASSLGKLNELGLPEVNTRRTSQLVTVKNAQTIVISGLVQNAEFETFNKIPLLGDIPLLGWLFRNSKVDHQENNLIIFLTPHVIHGPDDLAAIYQAKIQERDEFLEKIYGSGFKDDAFYARLPQAEDGAYKADPNDDIEKNRREAMLKEMRDDQGESEQSKTKETPEEKAAKADNGNITVPQGDGDSGMSDGGGGGGDIPPPPPPPPPPEDIPPPEPPPPPPEG